VFHTLLDAVLALYQRYVTADVPPVQRTLSEIGRILLRTRWNEARQSECIAGYAGGSHVTIVDRGAASSRSP
jgi:hypothetical protein